MLGDIVSNVNMLCYQECHFTEWQYTEWQNAECHFIEWHFTECNFTEWQYAECHFIEWQYAECHFLSVIMLNAIMLSLFILHHARCCLVGSVHCYAECRLPESHGTPAKLYARTSFQVTATGPAFFCRPALIRIKMTEKVIYFRNKVNL